MIVTSNLTVIPPGTTANPYRRSTPPNSVALITQRHQGGASGQSTSAAAASLAAAALSAAPWSSGETSADMTIDASGVSSYVLNNYGGPWSCYISEFRWKLGFHSATCYMEIWWEEVTYDLAGIFGETLVPESRSPSAKHFLWTPPSTDGFCLPSDFKMNDPTFGSEGWRTWPTNGDWTTITPVSSKAIYIENIRWSCLSGYEPAPGLYQTGFPA